MKEDMSMKIGNMSLKGAIKYGFDLYNHGINPVLVATVYLGFIREHTFNLKNVGKFKFNKDNISLLDVYYKFSDDKGNLEIITKLFFQMNDDMFDLGFLKFYNTHVYHNIMFFTRFLSDEYMVDGGGGGGIWFFPKKDYC
jgi:hypothetical protein